MWSTVVSDIISILLANGHEIIEFPLQQSLRERAKVLRYTYIARLVQIAAISVRSCGG
jgi:hypothetical protein